MKTISILTLLAAAVGLFFFGTSGFAGSAAEDAPTSTSSGQIKVYSVEQGAYILTDRVEMSDAEWREKLTEQQYHILREHGTERAFTGNLLHNQEHGVYRCAGCGLDLYHSSTKFKSGTGWPSFYQPVAPENIVTRTDRSFFMVRNELLCARCGSHLGHVFDDGPPPTGQRHCINSASLTFARLEE